MTSEQLLRAIGSIDDERLAEVEDRWAFTATGDNIPNSHNMKHSSVNKNASDSDRQPRSKVIRPAAWRKWAGLAACVLMLLVCISIPNMLRMGKGAETAMMTERAYDDAGFYDEIDSEESAYDVAVYDAAEESAEAEFAAGSTAETPAADISIKNAAGAAMEESTESLNDADSLFFYNEDFTEIRLGRTRLKLLTADQFAAYGISVETLSGFVPEQTDHRADKVCDASNSRIADADAYDFSTDDPKQKLILVTFSNGTMSLYLPVE